MTDYGTDISAIRPLIHPQSFAAGAALTSLVIDRAGFNNARIALQIGANAASGAAAFVVEHSDASGSGFTAIDGAAFALAAGAGNRILRGEAHLTHVKRYLRVTGTFGTGGATLAGGAIELFNARDTTQIAKDSGGTDEVAFVLEYPGLTSPIL